MSSWYAVIFKSIYYSPSHLFECEINVLLQIEYKNSPLKIHMGVHDEVEIKSV